MRLFKRQRSHASPNKFSYSRDIIMGGKSINLLVDFTNPYFVKFATHVVVHRTVIDCTFVGTKQIGQRARTFLFDTNFIRPTLKASKKTLCTATPDPSARYKDAKGF